jgi:Ca-activated chloride channel family protein
MKRAETIRKELPMAGSVQLSHALARPMLAATSTPQVVYALIEIMPTEVLASVRMPLNVSFVLDRSGSMEGDKIRCVREAIGLALDRLDGQDMFSVITFDTKLDVLVASQSAANTRTAKAKIGQLRANGGTQIALGMNQALKELQRSQPGALKRMLLLTDGQTNHDEADCLRLADQACHQGITITALGLGDDWNEALLQDIADRTGGKADYISRPAELLSFFQNDLASAQRAAVQHAVMNMRLIQSITPRVIWQVIPLIKNLGYQAISDRDLSVPLGELETGQGCALLVDLLVPPRPPGQFRIGQIELAYDIPSLGVVGEKTRQDILLSFTDQPQQAQQVNARVMNIVEKISAFRLQTQALKDAEAGNIAGATQKLRSAVTRLISQGENDLAATVQQEIANLEQQGQLSQGGSKTIKFGGSKTVRIKDIQ